MTWDQSTYQAQRIKTWEPLRNFTLNAAAGEVTFTGLPAKYKVISLIAYDASATPVLATVGLFTATGGGGTTILAATTLTALTAVTKYLLMGLAAIAGTDYQTSPTLFLWNGTAQGTALTVSFALQIQDLT